MTPADLQKLASKGPYKGLSRSDIFRLKIGKKSPDAVIACVGGGSNAIGTFYPLIDSDTEIIGVEAAGQGLRSGHHSATLSAGSKGVLHGMMTYLLQDSEGQGLIN